MNEHKFFEGLDARVQKYSLLCHPFYQAWSEGKLTRDDLRVYSAEYYHHVAAFPTYLSTFHSRLPDGELRRAVLENLCEEEIGVTAHSDLWLDFAVGMGNRREDVRDREPIEPITSLIRAFRRIAGEDPPAAVLAAFYAYESQVPEIAKAKVRGLREWYRADEASCRYFVLHETADLRHSRVWRDRLCLALEATPELVEKALETAQEAARALWTALDGIEEHRKALRN
jgi:pyrroloquinoline-quinone synthase